MKQTIHSLLVLTLACALGSACAHSTRAERASEAPSPSSTRTVAVPPGAEVAVIPNHPPIRTSGILDTYDPATGLIVFKDGRMVQLTPQSVIVAPAETPRRLEAGRVVVVQNVLPLGVRTSTAAGYNRNQRVGTVDTVDGPTQVVRLTDGQIVRVTPATKVHMGVNGSTVVLQDVRPGDEIIFVVADPNTANAEITEVMIFRPVTQ